MDSPPDLSHLFWITSDSKIEFSFWVYLDQVPRIRAVLPEATPALVEIGLREYVASAGWSIPSRAALERYRERASAYDTAAGQVVVQTHRLADLLVRYHLQRLVLPDGEVQLERDRRGRLTVSTLERLKQLHPGIYDVLYNKYITEACLFV